MDRYDPGFICNGSGKRINAQKDLTCKCLSQFVDDSGRYSYKQQPSICKWNCEKLAEALAPLLPLQKSKVILKNFDEEYERSYLNKMRQKVREFCFLFSIRLSPPEASCFRFVAHYSPLESYFDFLQARCSSFQARHFFSSRFCYVFLLVPS